MISNFDVSFSMTANMSTARKLFRLFKTFNEYVKIIAIRNGKLPDWEKHLQIITRIAFAFYWIFDNLSVLIKVKFLDGYDLKAMARRASKAWLSGIILSIIVALLELSKLSNRKSQLMLTKANKSSTDNTKETNEQFEADMKAIRASQTTQKQTIVKMLGDSITASQSLGYPERFFGFNFSDGWVGVGGFTSAALSCYQTYK